MPLITDLFQYSEVFHITWTALADSDPATESFPLKWQLRISIDKSNM